MGLRKKLHVCRYWMRLHFLQLRSPRLSFQSFRYSFWSLDITSSASSTKSVTRIKNIMFKPLFYQWTQIHKWVSWTQEFHLYTAERAHQNPKNNLLLLSTSADSNDSVSFLLYFATIFVVQFLVSRVPWNTSHPCTDTFVIIGRRPEGEAEFCPRWDNRPTHRTTATSSSYRTTL